MRAFLKVTLLTAGFAMLALFGLQYSGIIDVDWHAIDGLFDKAVARISTEAERFKTFITDIPSDKEELLHQKIVFEIALQIASQNQHQGAPTGELQGEPA